VRPFGGGRAAEQTDHRHSGLLCPRRERPKNWRCDHRSAEKRDEVAPLHEAFPSGTPKNAGRPPENQDCFEIAILCLPRAPGCQLLEAATSVRCRFLGSSQESNALDRVSTLHGFWFDVSGFECPLWVKSGHPLDQAPWPLAGFCRHALRCRPHTCGWVRLDWCMRPKRARRTADIRS
jgi:hypothetical protein